MGVTFTSNIGLAKPDEAELAENWVNGPNYNDDNNTLIENFSNIPMASYTPALIGSTTNPNLGAGATLGEYQVFRGFVFGRFRIFFHDPGIVAGIGVYGVSLPIVADGSYHTVGNSLTAISGVNSCIGDGLIIDQSTATNCGNLALELVTISGTSYVRMANELIAAKASAFVSNNQPFIPADFDIYTGWFFYKS